MKKTKIIIRCPQCGSSEVRTSAGNLSRCRRCGYQGPVAEFRARSSDYAGAGTRNRKEVK